MTIHLITAGKYQDQKNWPKTWNVCFESLARTKHNICVWNDEGIEQLLREDDNEFYEEYLSKLDVIYKIDYVRYIILEKYGGAYFDMDVELKIDFLQWIDNKTVYLLEGSIGELVTNAIMITYKECKLWSKIKDKARFNIIKNFELAKQDNYHTVELVGPLFLSKWIAHFWNLQRQQTKPFPNIELLGYHQFNNPLNNFYFTRHGSTHTWGGLNQNYSI